MEQGEINWKVGTDTYAVAVVDQSPSRAQPLGPMDCTRQPSPTPLYIK